MTNIIFKRKCKSVPHLRKKIYSKIGNNCLQQQWKTFLTNEQQLSPILHELSKAQFDIRNQDKFKYTARSILMMKREIIRFIEQNQLQKGKNKLKQLHEKVSHSQMRKIGMMIIYLECREELEKGLKSGKEQAIICWLKEQMNEHLNGNEISLIKIKLLTILSILLLRFHGILMNTDEKLIIFKTIELKKKKMLQMDVREERQGEFECLLYLLLQLYKILYLLKKDQQTIHFYYNQLHAYTQIYLTRQENKLYLDVNEINKILNSMKPILNELDIYEDSKLRKDLAFAHIQEEIILQESQSSKMLEIRKAQEKSRISSSIKISSHKQVRRSSIRNEQKLVIHNFINRNQDTVKQETIQNVLSIEKSPISFQFLLVSFARLYIIQVSFKFRNACNLVDLCLTIKNKVIMLQIYQLNGIQLAIERLTFKAIARFLQKVCELLFKANFYFRQMHNLYFADEYLPKDVDFQNVIIAMARIKTQVGQYIKQNSFYHSITGFKCNIPELTLQNIRQFFKKQGKTSESKSQRMMISRREGFILKETFQTKKSSQISIKVFLKRQYEKYHQYFFFNIYFDCCFKGIEIYYFSDKEETIELTDFINKLKKISSKLILEKRSVRKLQIISDMSRLQNKIQRIIPTVEVFKVEEELQINQQKLKHQVIHIKAAKGKLKRKNKINKPKVFQLIKMDAKKYYLFVKEIHNDFVIYKNDKAKLYLPLNWKQSEWSLVKNRLRLYAGIKIAHCKQSKSYFMKTYREEQSLTAKSQLIVLTFQRHKLLRKESGYSMLLEYQTENQQYLYEIIYNKQQRYYYLSSERLNEWPERLTVESIAEKYPFKLYQGIREKISEANWYYINVLKKQHST